MRCELSSLCGCCRRCAPQPMHARPMGHIAMLLLLPLWLVAPAGADEGQENCAGGTIVNPEPPASLVEHRVTMAYDDLAKRKAAFTTEDMVTAREGRHGVRTVFDQRSSLDDAGNSIELSARFCGLDYPECTKDDWKPAGLECAGVAPVHDQNCTSTEMAEYGIAIGLPSVFWIAFGITFMVLNALWYLARCCKLFGGMKAGKGCCCMKCVALGSVESAPLATRALPSSAPRWLSLAEQRLAAVSAAPQVLQ